jgi:hypothetical protein
MVAEYKADPAAFEFNVSKWVADPEDKVDIYEELTGRRKSAKQISQWEITQLIDTMARQLSLF